MTQQAKRSRGRPRAFDGPREGATIQSLDRAVRVMKILAQSEGMSLTEVSDAAGESPSTIYRVLTTLQHHGIVDFVEADQLWFIGVETFRIGSAFLGRTRLVERSRPVMRELMGRTGETANLAIADEGQVIFVSQVETHEPIRAFFRPGTRTPMHVSGAGKAMMAHYPQERIDALIRQQGLPGFTDSTITERGALIADLAATRARGWSVDDEERTAGMRCIAAPIFNEFGEAIAGISISGPSVRVSPERSDELGALVREAGDKVTRLIGGTRPPA